MRVLQQLFRGVVIASLSMAAGLALATPAAPEAGKEYRVLTKAQPVEAGKKIEVTEFFGYFCPHCNALEPLIAEWAKKHSDQIVFKRVHVNFHSLVTQQKLFLTLDTMGKLESHHIKAFNAYHVDRNRLQTDADVMNFVAKSGLDKQKFSEIYNSAFSMQSKVARLNQTQEAYQVDSVPMIAIDGRYVTSPSQAVSGIGRVTEDVQNRAALQVLDFLLAKAQKEKGISPAASSAPAATPAAPAQTPAKKK